MATTKNTTKPLTEEQKAERVAVIMMQKREEISVNILCNLIQARRRDVKIEDMVETSIKMADTLLGRLYPSED